MTISTLCCLNSKYTELNSDIETTESTTNRTILLATGVLLLLGAVIVYACTRRPTRNLIHSSIKLLSNRKNPLKATHDIINLPKDEHGNIHLGLDDKDFTLWRGSIQHLVSTKLFGPILIPTHPNVIKAILHFEKNGSIGSPFIGNRSTDNIHELYTHENPFAGTDVKTHRLHKLHFKNWITNSEQNFEKVYPVINNWLLTCNGTIISEDDIERLTAKIMITFLLQTELEKVEALVDAIITIKLHFTHYKTNPLKSSSQYQEALEIMCETIESLNESYGSYPNYLSADFTPEQINNHILTLMSVGFDNLQSTLLSLVVTMSLMSDEARSELSRDINPEGHSLIDFAKSGRLLTKAFFKELLRLTPPVWLQSRKSHGEESEITYTTEYGDKKSFTLYPHTLVIILNYTMNRLITEPETFDIHRITETYRTVHPFSQGPNTCPGQKIPYAALGVLTPLLLDESVSLRPISEDIEYKPSVALLRKNIQIRVDITPE